jgi:acyl-CoA thioester hydrolase
MIEVPLRWGDFDALGHVNHVAVLALLESGRDRWLRSVGIAPADYVVGRCAISFEREIPADLDAVAASCTAVELRRSSLTTSERLLDAAGATLVSGSFELVLWDPAQRRSRPISDRERAAFIRDRETIA